MLNSFTSSESFEQKNAGVFLLDCRQIMLENEKNTLIFWSEFQFDNFEQWRPPTPPTTTTTSTMPIHASGGPIITESTIKVTKSPTTTTMPSVMDLYKGFCYSQPLAYY